MTLPKRLARLEAQRQGRHSGPRVILFNSVWRDDDGNLQSIAHIAHVLTASGWQTLERGNDEPEAHFQLRADAMTGDEQAESAWAVAAMRRKHATPDPP